jgi:hypothetical protein
MLHIALAWKIQTMSQTRTTIELMYAQSKRSYCAGAMGRCGLLERRWASRLWSPLSSFEDNEWRTRQSSPSTSECDDDLYPNFFYTIMVLFFCPNSSLHFVPPPQWNNNYSCINCVTLFWPRSRRTFFQVSCGQQIPCISVTLQQLHFNSVYFTI